MKAIISMFILILPLSIFSQNNLDKPKDMVFIPMGSFETLIDRDGKEILLSLSVGAFWMSQEITNKEYREFVEDIKAHPEGELCWVNFKKLVEENDNPSGVNMEKYLETKKFSDIDDVLIDMDKQAFELYFTSKKYDHHPVVGVSQQAAKYYCIWRTDKENMQRQQQGLPLVQNYRLPVEAEWEYAAQGQNEQKILSANYPTSIKNGKANDYGLYHMLDNVAEWTVNQSHTGFRDNEVDSPHGIIKGGTAKQQATASERRVEDPNCTDSWIGFRIVRSYISR